MPMYRLIAAENKMELFRSQKFAERHKEADLETWLKNNLEVLTGGEPLVLIGDQVSTPLNGTLDLLALDADGNVVVVELKREKPPRDAIAQALEYAAWAAGQSPEDLITRADSYLFPQTLAGRWAEVYSPAAGEFDYGPPVELPVSVRLNESQKIFLVVEGHSERITTVAKYLRSMGIDFNLITFHYYWIHSGEEMIDFEIVVGPEQDGPVTPPVKGTKRAVSEEETIAQWRPELQDVYQHFRARMFELEPDGLHIDPTQAAISFRRQMPDRKKPVYVCSFEPNRGKGTMATVGIRKPSLQAYIDPEIIGQGLERDKQEGVIISNGKKWLTITCAPEPELVSRAAELVKQYILVPLADYQL